MSMPLPCPTAVELKALLNGTFPAADSARMDRHLKECGACRRQLNALAGGNESWLKGRPIPSADSLDSPPLREVMNQLQRGQSPRAVDAPKTPTPQGARLHYLGGYE